MDKTEFEPGRIHDWDGPGESFGCFCSREAEEWNGLVIGNRKKRRGWEDGKQEKEREKEGEGKQMGKGTYNAAMRTVFFPVILG